MSKPSDLNRRARYAGGFGAFLAMFGLIALLSRDAFDVSYPIRIYTTVAAAGLILFGVGVNLLLYLRGEYSSSENEARSITQDTDLAASIRDLSDRLEYLEGAPPPLLPGQVPAQASAQEVATAMLPMVKGELADVFEASYEHKGARARAAAAINSQFNAAVKRLEGEIRGQSRSGNLHLVIGSVTTLGAFIVLVYMVLPTSPENMSWMQLASHYVPRISIAIFIEVFAFFFLKLYKATLEESRRYNDDLSRITLQWVAVQTGWFAEEAGAPIRLAKDVFNAANLPKAHSVEAKPDSATSDRMVKAVLEAVTKELSARIKSEENDKKPDRSSSDDASE